MHGAYQSPNLQFPGNVAAKESLKSNNAQAVVEHIIYFDSFKSLNNPEVGTIIFYHFADREIEAQTGNLPQVTESIWWTEINKMLSA